MFNVIQVWTAYAINAIIGDEMENICEIVNHVIGSRNSLLNVALSPFYLAFFLSFFLNRPLLPCGVEGFLLMNLWDNW
jgi:hypothetical protein